MPNVQFKMVAQKYLANLSAALSSTSARRLGTAVVILFALPVFGLLTAFGVATDTQLEKISRQDITQELPLPDLNELAADPATSAAEFRTSDRIQRGDTVAELLRRLGVEDQAAFNFLRSDKSARSIFQLRPGRTVQAVVNNDREMISFTYLHSPEQYLQVTKKPDGFVAEERTITATAQPVFRSGTVKSSLYAATDAAGIPDAVATQIARIFSTDIDFHVDLRRGDRFSVVYEILFQDGAYLRPGRVLSAEFTNAGKTFEAFLFTDGDGTEGYYSADGQNRAKSFLRSALAFSRVSSGFGGRFHPLLKNWRQHTGVDFAAPKGTPIWATADGIVEAAGVRGGYGNMIEIRHTGGITTLYGHLSGFASGVRRGARVSQGQTIGFVGATGWATGPHLHYEFKVSGIHQDPLRVALPKAEPLSPRYLGAFQQAARAQGEQLALLRDTSFSKFE